MQYVRGHRQAPGWDSTAVAIGNFDGVHLGHRALLHEATTRGTGVALTFDPHPSAVLSSKGGPAAISTLGRRLELLASCGVAATVVEPFTRELAGMPPEAFVDQVLVQALRAKTVVVGYDFSYGCERGGSIDTLRAHGARAGFEVVVVPPVHAEGDVVSSTRIRGLLRAGDVETAARLLARPWDLDGPVVHGAKRGRTIGVPTANIATSELLVCPGIYAVTLAVEGGPPLPAVASLGTNPTFVDDGRLVLEVHVLDFSGDLYDRAVRVGFIARLRDEAKYDSIDALLVQIRQDIADARAKLNA